MKNNTTTKSMKNTKQKHVLKTLSIGIPAHNEEATLPSLISSIAQQKHTLFTLENVYILNDASTDNTVELANSLSKKYPFVHLVNDGQRLGKAARLNALYKANKSDILVCFDGDIQLTSNRVLEEMVKALDDKDVALATTNKLPHTPINFFEKLIYTLDMLWYDIRLTLNGGDNVYNVAASGIGINGTFAKTLKLPAGTSFDAEILFISALRKYKKTVFLKDVPIYFHLPANLADYISQSSRVASPETRKIINSANEIYVVPNSLKIKAIIKSFAKHPILTPLSFALLYYVRRMKKKHGKVSKTPYWDTAASTKRAFTAQ